MDRPQFIETEYGVLEFSTQYTWYEGNLTIDDKPIYVLIDMPEGNDTGVDSFGVFERVAKNLALIDETCREYSADELLDGANDWRADSDEEGEYSRAEFMDLMELESFCINKDGSYQLGYADGDMFWGHSIMVDINVEGEIEYADIAG